MKFLNYLLFFSALTTFMACKKDETNAEQWPDSFSFKYNGITYNGLNNGGMTGNGRSGPVEYIFIKLPGSLNNTIYYYTYQQGCAYMIPNSMAGLGLTYANCQFSSNSGPIDSAQVYFYRSGSISYTVSNCVHIKKILLQAPGTIEYDECTVTGNFNIILGNNNNQTIKITDGAFTFHKVRK